MADIEDLVHFFMHAHIDRGVSLDVVLIWLARVNGVEVNDARVLADYNTWIATTKAKLLSPNVSPSTPEREPK